MISSKHITKITLVLISVVLILCVLAMVFSDSLLWAVNTNGYTAEYRDALFDTSQITDIDIIMDENDWNDMLKNAIQETYYKCDVEINNTVFYEVGIRTKGNTSLSSVANDPDNDRYSFKLEFDRFVDGQTCFGLDKLVLNNNYADPTNMKEAVIYDMFRFLDADASLYNYAKISVNGEYWGVYLALEAVEDSFMLRNYGTQKGFLYKPDSMDGGKNKNNDNSKPQDGGNRPDRQNSPKSPNGLAENNGMPAPPEGQNAENRQNRPPRENSENQGNAAPTDGKSTEDTIPVNNGAPFKHGEQNGGAPNGNGGGNPRGGPGGGNGGGGANLNYTDDSLDSYSTIWNSEITNGTDSDHKRVVEALKNISNGTDIDKYVDVEQILKYMAVHNFSVNEDSLSGAMAHNYYLYESGGKLSIIPWDYNLSFGGMNGGNATDTVNDPIDEEYSSTDFFDFVLENEEYKARYHEYYSKLVNEYLYGGKFEETYRRIRSQIDELVKTDPNAMYDFDEYTKGAEVLYETVMLRAESVKGQLDGTIPSTEEGKKENSSALVDVSHINLSDMGQFMGGGKSRGR